LAHTKYCNLGHKIYKTLCKICKDEFEKAFSVEERIYLIPIDDVPKRGYSQNGIFANEFKNKNLIPLYRSLRAKNGINYAGKNLEFRKANKKDFQYLGKSGIDAILLDDIVTTGQTMLQAREILRKNGVNPLFGLTIFDARGEDDGYI